MVKLTTKQSISIFNCIIFSSSLPHPNPRLSSALGSSRPDLSSDSTLYWAVQQYWKGKKFPYFNTPFAPNFAVKQLKFPPLSIKLEFITHSYEQWKSNNFNKKKNSKNSARKYRKLTRVNRAEMDHREVELLNSRCCQE